MSRVLTVKEAAALLKTTRQQIRKLINERIVLSEFLMQAITRGSNDVGRVHVQVECGNRTVHGFAAVSEGADYTRFTAACIGRQTMETAESYGMNCRMAEKATIESLTELVERIQKDR